MDFAYSPHREPGGTMHLASPTHPHSYRLDGTHFSSIQQLRRSLSRSPSKPSRFHLRKSDSPGGSPISPLALARAFSPRQHKDTSTPAALPDSPLSHTPATTTKKKFTLRRTAPFRSSPRNRPNSKSPRRVLTDSTDQGNATPFSSRRTSGEENMAMRRISAEYLDKMGSEQKPAARFDIDDKPIKFEFARSRQQDSSAPGANCMTPIKSSPLKRSDGVMNLDTASKGSGSPVAKRRSLHGSSSFGTDFDVFEHGPTPRSSGDEPRRALDAENGNGYSFSSPLSGAHTPLRKAASLRKSTLSQRQQFSNTPRPKPVYDGEFALPMEAASKSRNRMSLDSSLGHSSGTTQSPFRMSGNYESAQRTMQHQPFLRGGPGNHQPHPLSNALTQSPSISNMNDQSSTFVAPAQPTAAPRNHQFSRSLPIGTTRPQPPQDMQESQDGSYATPAAYRMAKPNPVAFMSTGLLSKKNRNVDDPSGSSFGTYVMPDTPSKRMSFPPAVTDTPLTKRNSLFGKPSQPSHEFGTPSTPFSAHASKISSESFGKGVNIFGSFGSNHQRRSSFASIDGEDVSNSPTGNHMTDSQSSADDMPPTPTKQNDGSGRRSKESSLRRKTFRQRTSLGSDTFAAPGTPSINIPMTTNVQNSKFSPSSISPSSSDERLSPSRDGLESAALQSSPSSFALSSIRARLQRQTRNKGRTVPFRRRSARSTLHPFNSVDTAKKSPLSTVFGASSPHTPSESFYPPDPSNLSISGPRRGSLTFGDSTSSILFPPATPTTPRDSSSYFGNTKPIVIAGLTKNDIDTSLTSRFESVEKMEKGGEFSFVYKVRNPVNAQTNMASPSASSEAWIVKKTKKPYFGAADRAKKIREVEILQALRGNEHIVSLFSHWEFDSHLYMQMEYCESGDLFTFLAKEGNKSRLDDFRIWKIMLEMASGVKHIHDSGFIHLDLKPANVFIDFGGSLKIGDFGLASSWPAPPHIDAEGDRHYLAPEVLNGRPDKASDVYMLGAIMLEIGSNSELPENGVSWRQLRSGDFSGMPSLTWSSESALDRDADGHPITDPQSMMSDANVDPLDSNSFIPAWQQAQLAKAPRFMMDPTDDNSLNRMVEWMMAEEPRLRPTIDQVLSCQGCQWVEGRSRAAATIYEGNFGPDDDVLDFGHQDVDMADMMDTS
ncbi:hypothetical protein K505DRAFT_368819 [Melanomma pulvis-pyrius CBS 109.77]|uniref:Protein kinase domain-containing protein n=1 Tax=Melanomma pulvis-pyrius CBS 109.77 TaxID=1314802 RepID=A0A6A6WNU5_9PLEO|nr:hypothetical protein K505DRAFT_368819 [Melanomma pulvis-pyrius CBS 109.77]